jgi:arylsulfatase A-like enzyme
MPSRLWFLPRRRSVSVILCLIASSLLSACTISNDTVNRPNLILIVVDNLRADRVGIYGHDRRTTPTLDGLGRQGVVFENAFAPASWTKPATASLFTSRWPSEHGAVTFERGIDAAVPTLAEVLAAAGYMTIGVSGNFVHVREDMGFARGFSTWRASKERTEADAPDLFWGGFDDGTPAVRATPGPRLVRKALREIPRDRDSPLFLYVHLMDPHVPWTADAEVWKRLGPSDREPPSPVTSDEVVELAAQGSTLDAQARQRLLDAYDMEIFTADKGIAELLDGLRQLGVCGECVVIVTSDHGEEFADHGGWFHGLTLHQEVLRVPLILYDSRRPGQGRRESIAVDLLDIAPTLVELGGAPRIVGARGHDLLDGRRRERTLVAELHADEHFVRLVGPPRHRLSLLRWPWKVLREPGGAHFVYRLDRDPLELARLGVEEAPADLASTDALEGWIDRLVLPGGEGADISQSDEEALRALGYVR